MNKLGFAFKNKEIAITFAVLLLIVLIIVIITVAA